MKKGVTTIPLEITDEDKRVVKMLADGKKGKNIAKEQGVNYNTFAFNLGLIKSKCGVTNTPQLVSFFLRNKLID